MQKNLQAVIKKLITSKGIHCRNIEGTKLINNIDDDDAGVIDEEDDEFVISSDESNSHNENGENVEDDNEKMVNFENEITQSKVIQSLMNVCADSLTNKEAKFLDAPQDLLEGNETRDIFEPLPNKMKSVF